MNKKILLIILILGVITVVGFVSKNPKQPTNNNQPAINNPTAQIIADKIEVIHFHATQQCWSCITVGEYALKTIKERFPEEYKNGTITYRDVNGELPENWEIVTKYQARGSSLYTNAIASSTDNITEDITVWRLINSEQQFLNYFESKLKKMLGK